MKGKTFSSGFLWSCGRSIPFLLTLILTMSLVLPSADAQSTGGRIRGTVVDASGGAVVGATVTLINEATHATRDVQTGSNGEYIFLEVPVGSYEIDAASKGFKKYVRKGVPLDLNAVISVDIALQVGGATDVVEVTGAPPVIDTTSTQLGAVMNSVAVSEMPLNTRDTYQLLQLQPGVMSQLGAALFTGSENPGVVSVNGGRGRANNYQVNGGTANDVFINLPVIQPSPDAVEEFRMITNTFDAEFGRNSGAVVNVVTKSGTNDIHGDVYEFIRNKALNAKNFFDLTKGDFKQNQFGATLGGPIKKDKSFIFGSYEGRRIINGVSSGTVVVPSSGELSGDFSAQGLANGVVDPNGFSGFAGTLSNSFLATVFEGRAGCRSSLPASAVITNPNTNQTMTVTPQANLDAVAAGTATATQSLYSNIFANFVIPSGCFDPTAKDLASFIPAANRPDGTFTSNPSDHSRGDQLTVRFDQTLTSKQQFNAYYYFDDSAETQPFPFFQAAGANVPGFGSQFAFRFQQWNFSHTWTIGSSAVNEARFTYFREAQGKNDHPVNISKDGTAHSVCPTVDPAHCFSDPANPGAGITTDLPGHAGVPFITISGGAVIGNNFEGELPQIGNVFQWTDNFSRVVGKHSLKFGADVSRAHFNQNLFFETTGGFTFLSSATGPSGNDLGFSDAYGNYLLGLPTSYGQGAAQDENVRTTSLYLYAQDSWKIRPSLTLNYGLRWELNTPYNEIGHRVQTYRPGQADTIFPCVLSPTYPSGAPNPTYAALFAAAGNSNDCSPSGPANSVFPLGLVIPGDKGIPNGLTQTYYKSFAPRLGLAWSPSATSGLLSKLTGGPGKTSIRMGWGIFYNPIEQLVLEQFSAEPPFGGSPFLSGTLFNLPFEFQAGGFAPNPFGGILNPTRGQPVDWSIFRPMVLFGEFQPNMRSQYSEQYNFTIQRQLASSLLFQIGYVGSQGHRLLQSVDMNPGQAQPCLDLQNISNLTGDGSLACGPFFADTAYTIAANEIPAGVTLHLPYGSVPSVTGPNPNPITIVGLRRFSSPNCEPTTGAGCPPDGVPVFGSIFAQNTVGNSGYNSLQAMLQKSMSHGLQFQASYTFSKSIDSSSSFESIVNYLDARKSRGLSAFDARHRFVFSPYWELPIPKHEGFAGKVANGWAVSSIITFQSGFPIRINSSNDTELGNSFDFEPVGEPNIVAPIRFLNPHTQATCAPVACAPNQLFDPNSFADAPVGQFGNAPRTLCCGPRISQSDISIEKKTRLTERFNTEFRAEFFNAWNHTQFLSPDGNFTDVGSTFGAVQKARDPRLIQFALKILF
ncbi:MAG TPA: carboxypeptidase-like regulatory domain-containing protein [Candidatus Acidoferrum sp.]|nr:carboxypeptidase-like regulatory domain-containing protein [Candidatus Acidoferrum sp.]